MKRITEHLSKEVVTIAEGEIAGIITNAYVTEKLTRVKGFIVSSDEKEEAGLADLRRIAGCEDALTLPSADRIKQGIFFACPLGAKTFDSEGRFLGVLRDLVFDERTGATATLVTDESEFSPSLVIAATDRAVVLRAEAHAGKAFKRTAAKKGATRPKRSKSEVRATEIAPVLEESDLPIGETEDTSPNRAGAGEAAIPDEKAANIAHISDRNEKNAFSGDYDFLIGRMITKDLLFSNGSAVKKGEIVSKAILDGARTNGKLVELTVNSRRV
ncbi:MAG: hypothetical protein K5753_03935 [Clostridia bacterium]|nr:hypothetical protein [Clostridia bacterium]